jgi:hypothetical protein
VTCFGNRFLAGHPLGPASKEAVALAPSRDRKGAAPQKYVTELEKRCTE